MANCGPCGYRYLDQWPQFVAKGTTTQPTMNQNKGVHKSVRDALAGRMRYAQARLFSGLAIQHLAIDRDRYVASLPVAAASSETSALRRTFRDAELPQLAGTHF